MDNVSQKTNRKVSQLVTLLKNSIIKIWSQTTACPIESVLCEKWSKTTIIAYYILFRVEYIYLFLALIRAMGQSEGGEREGERRRIDKGREHCVARTPASLICPSLFFCFHVLPWHSLRGTLLTSVER